VAAARRGARRAPWETQLFPPLALVLVLIPIFKLTEISFAVWPVVLLVDLLAIGLAVLTASLLSVLAVLLLTLVATGALIFKIPETLTGLPTPFFLIGVFAVFFVVVGVWLARKLKPGGAEQRLCVQRGPHLAGQHRSATAHPLLRAALPAADHGHAAAAADESIACIRAGVAAGGPDARVDETLIR
jgi:hypothetical protein